MSNLVQRYAKNCKISDDEQNVGLVLKNLDLQEGILLCRFMGPGGKAYERQVKSSNIHPGPVPLSCRPKCSFKPLSVRRRRGFSSPMLSGVALGCRSR